LSNGWEGYVISTQRFFSTSTADLFDSIYTRLIVPRKLDVLDGGMVILAIYTLNIAHPGLLLFRDTSRKDLVLEEKTSTPSAEAEPTSDTPSQEAA
jgi:hypothetical protein